MMRERIIRCLALTTMVTVSLILIGSVERRVSHFDLGYTEQQNPGKDWISYGTGWPNIKGWKVEHVNGMSSTTATASSFDDPIVQWWYDNDNRLIWMTIIFFTMIQTYRINHGQVELRKVSIRNLVFLTTLVFVFVSIDGLKPYGPWWILLFPISFGISCVITEAVFISWRTTIVSLNGYLIARNALLRFLALEKYTRPLIDA